MQLIYLYAFRTTPFLSPLKNFDPNLFTFGQLTNDFKIYSEKLLDSPPDLIIGVAKMRRKTIQWESQAINSFHGNKKIDKEGKENYSLFIPSGNKIRVNKDHYDTFCNWTMYKIAQYIEEKNLPTKFSFIHLHEDYVEDLAEIIKKLSKPASTT